MYKVAGSIVLRQQTSFGWNYLSVQRQAKVKIHISYVITRGSLNYELILTHASNFRDGHSLLLLTCEEREVGKEKVNFKLKLAIAVCWSAQSVRHSELKKTDWRTFSFTALMHTFLHKNFSMDDYLRLIRHISTLGKAK